MSEQEYVGRDVVARWNDEYARVIVAGIGDMTGRGKPPPGWALLADGASRRHAAEQMRQVAAELMHAADACWKDG